MELALLIFPGALGLGVIYALIALGVVLIYKATHVFNFAQGHFVMLMAIIAWFCFANLPFYVAIPVLIIAGVGVAMLVERLFLRPLIGQPILSPIILTLAMMAFIQGICVFVWGMYSKPFPLQLTGTAFAFGMFKISWFHLTTILAGLGFFGVFGLFYRRALLGKAMRATAEDHQVSQSLGIKVKNIFTISWVIAMITAILAGVLMGMITGVHAVMHEPSAMALPAVLLGGLDSVLGALVGGVIIGLLQVYGTAFLNPFFGQVLPWLVLLLIIIVKPYGLFGEVRIERI